MTTPQTPQQIARRVLELDAKATPGPWYRGSIPWKLWAGPKSIPIFDSLKDNANLDWSAFTRTAAPELARAVIKAESDLAEMREENERLAAALKPFVDAFERERASYSRRNEGAALWFNRMPDKWPITVTDMTIGFYRAAEQAYRAAQGVEGEATPPSES